VLFGAEAISQVYPYGFSINSITSGKTVHKYGLVSDQNEKITEPIFDYIEPFLNQEYNNYTVYVEKNTDVKDGLNNSYGLIDKSGNKVSELMSPKLSYDGNGAVVFIKDNGNISYVNIKTKKTIFENGESSVVEITKAQNVYLIIRSDSTSQYSVIDENGKEIIAKREMGYIIKLHEIIDGRTFFDVTNRRNNRSKFYNEEGIEVTWEDMHGKQEIEFYDQILEDDIVIDAYKEITPQIRNDLLTKYPESDIIGGFKGRDGNLFGIKLKVNGKMGLVTMDGRKMLDFKYDNIWEIYTDLNGDYIDDREFYKVVYNGLNGVYRRNFKVIIEPKFYGDFTFVRKPELITLYSQNGYSGYASENGEIYLPKECECLD